MASAQKPTAPVVSIVMAVHGDGKWLAEALESAVEQVFLDWELLCVLDAVSPNVLNVVKRFSSDSRVKIFHCESHIGASRARNIALYEAQGFYIANLDSDDTWEPNHLDNALRCFNRKKIVALVGLNFKYIDQVGRPKGRHKSVLPIFQEAQLLARNFFGHSAVVFRRDFALELGGYPKDVKIGEDYCLWLGMAQKGRVLSFSKYTAKYRLHETQASLSLLNRLSAEAVLECRLNLAETLRIPPFVVRVLHRVWLSRQKLDF